jgi:hypothetical protein
MWPLPLVIAAMGTMVCGLAAVETRRAPTPATHGG